MKLIEQKWGVEAGQILQQKEAWKSRLKPLSYCRPAQTVIGFLSQSKEMRKIQREVKTKEPGRLLQFQLSLGRGETFVEDNTARKTFTASQECTHQELRQLLSEPTFTYRGEENKYDINNENTQNAQIANK